jgi:hypothetical protein
MRAVISGSLAVLGIALGAVPVALVTSVLARGAFRVAGYQLGMSNAALPAAALAVLISLILLFRVKSRLAQAGWLFWLLIVLGCLSYLWANGLVGTLPLFQLLAARFG